MPLVRWPVGKGIYNFSSLRQLNRVSKGQHLRGPATKLLLKGINVVNNVKKGWLYYCHIFIRFIGEPEEENIRMLQRFSVPITFLYLTTKDNTSYSYFGNVQCNILKT